MTIRHLKIFVTVVQCNGMRAAAKQLYISQPSVSQAIAELEKHYNVRLFERYPKKLYITEAGKMLLPYARQLVGSFEELEDIMVQQNSKQKLTIGASVSVGTTMLTTLIEHLKENMPQLDVYVQINNTTKIEEMLIENEVDLAIVEGVVEQEELEVIPIYEDELVIISSREHPLAKKSQIPPITLNHMDFIAREAGSNDRNQFEQYLSKHDVKVCKKWVSTNTEAIKNAVIKGNGLAIISRMLIQEELKSNKLAVLDIKDAKIHRQIKLIYHKNKYITEQLQLAIDLSQNLTLVVS